MVKAGRNLISVFFHVVSIEKGHINR